MDILEVIDQLEEKIEKAFNIPVLNKCMIDKEDLLADVEDIRLQLPEELKQARWLKEERKRILAEANHDADEIVKKAEEKTVQLINEHEITKKAYEQANDIVTAAQNNAKEIRAGLNEYCEDMLNTMESKFVACIDAMRETKQEIKK